MSEEDEVDNLRAAYKLGYASLKTIEDEVSVIVPDRKPYEPILTVSGIVSGGQEKEDPKIDTWIKKYDEYISEWTENVEKILRKIKKRRFLVLFDNPQARYFCPIFIKGFETDKEKYLISLLYDFGYKVHQLKDIIIEYCDMLDELDQDQFVQSEAGVPWFDKKQQVLRFAGQSIGFKSNAIFTPALVEILMSDLSKESWTFRELQTVWDDQYEYIGIIKKNDWQKVRKSINDFNSRVKKETGIGDLFLFNTKIVSVNPKYTKK